MIKDRTLGNTKTYGTSSKGRPPEELPEQPSEKGEKHICAFWEPNAETASRLEWGHVAKVLLSWTGFHLLHPSSFYRNSSVHSPDTTFLSFLTEADRSCQAHRWTLDLWLCLSTSAEVSRENGGRGSQQHHDWPKPCDKAPSQNHVTPMRGDIYGRENERTMEAVPIPGTSQFPTSAPTGPALSSHRV